MCNSNAGDDQYEPDEAKDVRAVWRSFGLPGIIDVHTHFMPQAVIDKVWAYFDGVLPSTGIDWSITYRSDESTRVRTLDDFGVQKFTSMIYPHKPEMAEWLNSWAHDFAVRTPQCLSTATFFPEASAPRYVGESIDRGVRIFKSHIQVGDYDPNSAILDQVWGQIEDAGLPVVIHCGSGPAPGRYTGPARIESLLARFPDLALVIAHMGMPEYSEFLRIAERYPKTRFDTTMSFTDFTNRLARFPDDERDTLIALEDRILFGSDFPNIPYKYADALRAIVDLDLGAAWCRKVLYENALELFEL